MALAARSELARGVWTASAGNMAQGVAWCARRARHPVHGRGPGDGAARRRSRRSNGWAREVVKVPFERVVARSSGRARSEGIEGLLRPRLQRPAVMAGNGTIGLEILEDLPDVDAVVIPYGGGGLIVRHRVGAAGARARRAQVYAAEVATAAPLAASLAAGRPTQGRVHAELRRRDRRARACSPRCSSWPATWSTARWCARGDRRRRAPARRTRAGRRRGRRRDGGRRGAGRQGR